MREKEKLYYVIVKDDLRYGPINAAGIDVERLKEVLALSD